VKSASGGPWPSFKQEEAEAVKRVLLSNRVNAWTGNQCKYFEKEFADWVGTKHAISLMNGTVALELALRGLGIGPGDEVIVTPRTFIASISCIVAVGAKPVFADVELDSQNISARTITEVLSPKTKAIICVHLAGWPCEMDDIMSLAETHNLYVIEDCAQAHGAKYRGKSVGSIGHVAAWSFCQDKIMTTGGEGGMVTTNDEALWKRMWAYKDHGKSWDAVQAPQREPGFRWLHEGFGTNWRMTEMQAAIGRIQLKRMPLWHEKRLANAKRIWETAQGIDGLSVPAVPAYIEHAAYKAYVFVDGSEGSVKLERDRIMHEIQTHDVSCFAGSCSEVYLEKAFDNTSFRPKQRLKNAALLADTALMFLVHPTLSEESIERTCLALRAATKKGCPTEVEPATLEAL